MTFGAVVYVWVTTAAALAVVVLHLLARRRPRPAPLPTARFVPVTAVRAPAFHRRPSDLMLLALRVLALLLLGLALARPQVRGPTRPVGEIVIGDSVATFSQAFAAAFRVSATSRASFDSLALTLEMPLTHDAWDASTREWRDAWPGSVRVSHRDARRRGGAVVVWPALDPGNSVSAVVVGNIAAVGRWGRGPLPEGVDVAWFNDGTGAAVEVATDSGCVRHVAIGMPSDDSRFGPAFRRIEGELRSAACGEVGADFAPLDSADVSYLEGQGGPAAVASLPAGRLPVRPSILLLVFAALAVLGEQLVRKSVA